MNDLLKKKGKNILLLGQTELFLKYIDSILHFATKKDEDDVKVLYFTLNKGEKDQVCIDKHDYHNGFKTFREKARKITK